MALLGNPAISLLLFLMAQYIKWFWISNL